MSKSNQRTVINPFKPLINRLPVGLQNRYYLILIVFILWVLIFDKANIWAQYKLQSTIKRLESDRHFYEIKLKEVQQEKIDIERDKEKFAREHYFMKTNDEDVFIIEKKKN
jgi:cell division protein DivIC